MLAGLCRFGQCRGRRSKRSQGGTHGTGHTEAVRVTYDPARVSYAQLVDFFWKHIDPTAKDRQFCDSGNQYRSGCGRDARVRQLWGTR
jgi:peptide methionine sulfoxide reductase MsrA